MFTPRLQHERNEKATIKTVNENTCQSPDKPPCVVSVSSQQPQWDSFLARREDATVYHDPRWGGVMLRAYGNRPFYLTARRDGRIVGTLLLVGQKSLLFGSHLCSVPYFDAAGILADDTGACAALLEAAAQVRDGQHAEWAEIRQLTPIGESIPSRTDKVTMWLDIADSEEAMWRQLKTKVRTKVRKVRKGDLVVTRGGAECLDDYFAMYSRTMRDLGSPPHSKKFFRLIIEIFGEAVSLFVARSGSRALAASLALIDGWGFHLPWSGSDVRHRRLGANRLLYWSMLAFAAEAGCGRFDFGRSTPESGTYAFKKEWGAEPVALHWHYLMAQGRQLPSLRPDSPKYRLMVACWKKLPLRMARAIGPGLIGKLS